MATVKEATSKGHPKGLGVLFATEMWERFNYYGMRAVLILFMTKALFFDKAFASNLYGSYTGLVFLTPLIGGLVADRLWGNQRSIITGGIVMAIGEFIMFGCASIYRSNPELSSVLFFCGLGLIITGNGFFKPNISSLVGQLYPDGDNRKDAAYTIFYMGINVGGAMGPIICSLVGDTGNPLDFKWAFFAAAIGMVISVIVQLIFHKKYVKGPDGRVLGMLPQSAPKQATNMVYILIGLVAYAAVMIGILYADARVYPFLSYLMLGAVILIAWIIFRDKLLSRVEKDRLLVIFIASFFVVFFWSAYEQAGASLNFFADEQTQRDLGFWTIPASLFQSLNSIFIVLFAPVFAFVWVKMGKKEPSALTKMAIGLLLLSLGFAVIAYGVKGVAPSVKISFLWLTIMYAMHTWGELCLSPIGLSLVNKLSPFKLASLMMAVWFLANAGANKLAGVLSALYPEEQKIEAVYIVANENIHADTTALLNWGEVQTNRNAVAEGKSWSYSLAKKASGVESDSLRELTIVPGGNYKNYDDSIKTKRTYPETLKRKELEFLQESGKSEPKFYALLIGTGTKLGVLKQGETISTLEVWNLYPEKHSLFGRKINTLYDFFLIFVIMSGVASVILFILSGRLQKMVHGAA
jgi:POT family proton-dependent oligopeptide transporter